MRTEKFPKEWNEAVIEPEHKKGGKLDCKNFTATSLMNICYKALFNTIKKTEQIADHQGGFMKGGSIVDEKLIKEMMGTQ